MIIQEQKWHSHTRILFVDEYGSVMLELFDEPQFGELNMTAFIFNLWTDPKHRLKGHASELLKLAEEEASKRGHAAVFLDWELEQTPSAVLDWYLRNGYRVVGFNNKGDFNRLRKELSTSKWTHCNSSNS